MKYLFHTETLGQIPYSGIYIVRLPEHFRNKIGYNLRFELNGEPCYYYYSEAVDNFSYHIYEYPQDVVKGQDVAYIKLPQSNLDTNILRCYITDYEDFESYKDTFSFAFCDADDPEDYFTKDQQSSTYFRAQTSTTYTPIYSLQYLPFIVYTEFYSTEFTLFRGISPITTGHFSLRYHERYLEGTGGNQWDWGNGITIRHMYDVIDGIPRYSNIILTSCDWRGFTNIYGEYIYSSFLYYGVRETRGYVPDTIEDLRVPLMPRELIFDTNTYLLKYATNGIPRVEVQVTNKVSFLPNIWIMLTVWGSNTYASINIKKYAIDKYIGASNSAITARSPNEYLSKVFKVYPVKSVLFSHEIKKPKVEINIPQNSFNTKVYTKQKLSLVNTKNINDTLTIRQTDKRNITIEKHERLVNEISSKTFEIKISTKTVLDMREVIDSAFNK